MRGYLDQQVAAPARGARPLRPGVGYSGMRRLDVWRFVELANGRWRFQCVSGQSGEVIVESKTTYAKKYNALSGLKAHLHRIRMQDYKIEGDPNGKQVEGTAEADQ